MVTRKTAKSVAVSLRHPVLSAANIKNDYATLVSFLTAVSVALNQLSPILDFIPASKPVVSAIIVGVGFALTFLKNNESLVDNL